MSYRVMFPLAFIALLGFAGANGQGGPGGGPGGPPGTNGGPTGGTTAGGPGGGAGGMIGASGIQSSDPFIRGGCCNEKNAGGPSGRFPICMVEEGNGVFTDGMAPPSDSCGGGPSSDPESDCSASRSPAPVSDCADCGGNDATGGGGASAEVNAGLNRRFLPRNQAFYSSYGPGNFGSYDKKFYLYSAPEGGNALQLFDFSSGIVFEMVDGVAGEPLDGVFHDERNKLLKQLTLNDANGNPTTTLSAAASAELEDWRGVTTEFSMINLSNDPQAPDYAGRLTKVTDEKGYSLTVSYRDALPAGGGGFTPQELMDSPDRRFQIHQVVDYQSDTATFEYGTTQVGGRWAISRIVMPGGDDVDYTYTGDRLTKVTYANGSESTFTYGQDSTAQTVTIDAYEARGGRAPRTIHLTNDYMTVNNQIINQPQGVLRMIEDENHEVSMMLVPDSNEPAKFLTYQGSSMAAEMIQGVGSQYYEDGWTFNPIVAVGDPIDGDLEPTYDSAIGATTQQLYQGTVPQVTDATGRTYSFEYDADTFPTKKIWDGDGTYEEYEYDADKNTTRMRDRMGRVTKYEYDSFGNVTKKMVGILEVNGTDVNQPEYLEQVNEYYPASHVNKGLLKTAFSPLYDGISTNMYRTDYEYDARGNVTKMLESAAHAGEDRPEWTYTYDSEDRRLTQVDPIGHTISYLYDDQDRLVRTTYDDGSTSETLYGAAGTAQEHLVLKTKDRRDVVTDYAYDTSDRPVTVTRASATDANILDGQIDNPITDRNKKSITTYAYLEGTELPTSVAVDGSTTDTVWDYRHRALETTTYPAVNKSLTTREVYVDNDLFFTTDPYGRFTYYGYRASDDALIRYVTGAFTTFSLADEAAVFALTRDQSPNAPYIVKDALKNDAGQLSLVIDGRGIQHRTEYDFDGNAILQIAAFGTPVEARTETDYDDAGRPIEVRTPRYFDSNDTNGFQKCKTLITYDGRGNLASRSESPGTPEDATELFTYTLDNKQATRTDFRGKVWTTSYAACCGQSISTKSPLGHGRITNTDYNGNRTHIAGIADTELHANLKNPVDAKTLKETTTLFDEIGRSIASTRWLVQQGEINPNAIPIAGLDGVSANDGLTSQALYDVDLTDGVGLDSATGMEVSKLGGGTYNVSLSTAITKLTESGSTGGGNLIFVPGATGSAIVTVNAEEELSFSIFDSTSRSVMRGAMEPPSGTNPNALVNWDCSIHDSMYPHTDYGGLLETIYVSATGNRTLSRLDGAGRLLQSVDAGDFTTEMSYDATGNLVSTRDPNNVGTDCLHDERGRQLSCTDPTGRVTQTAYDRHGNVISNTDAKGQSSTVTFDARGRRATVTDRLGNITSWTYDSAGNQVSFTDTEGQTTIYAYDDAGQATSIQYADHVSGSAIGDPGYGMVHYMPDAIGRTASIENQQGDLMGRVYDLAGRLTSRTYTGHASGPLAGQTNTDNFTYDRQGRIVNATKGRYGNSVSFTYDDQGRKATESLTAHNQTYLTAYSYDVEGRLQTTTAPDGSASERTYTDRGQLASVDYTPSGGATQSVATFSYDDGNRESSRTLGNGLTTTRTYFNDNQVQSIATPSIETLTYAYDANQNPTSESRSGVMSPYSWSTGASGFDDEDRLVSWARTNGDSQSWSLSEAHDWDSFTINGASQTRTHGAAHEILTMSGANVPGEFATIQHDTKGNLTQDHRGAIMAWDFDNKLESFTANSTTGLSDATYEYDALGRRIAKSVAQSAGGTLTTIFTHAEDQVIAEYTAANAVTDPERKYVYGEYIDELLLLVDAETGSEQTVWLHGARQYNIMAMTNASGIAEEYYAYTPHGERELLTPTGASQPGQPIHNNRYAYTGREWDDAIGRYHFRARFLDPVLGQFGSRDPVGYIDGQSLYRSYFGLSGMDPTGLRCCFYLWRPRRDKWGRKLRQGHVAIECNGKYMSFWPKKYDGPTHTYKQDVQWEGGKEDRKHCFEAPENKILKCWPKIWKRPFSRVGGNCTTAASELIKCGVTPCKDTCGPCKKFLGCGDRCGGDNRSGCPGIDRPGTFEEYINCYLKHNGKVSVPICHSRSPWERW